MQELFMNVGGIVYGVFLVYIINRVYTVLSEMKEG